MQIIVWGCSHLEIVEFFKMRLMLEVKELIANPTEILKKILILHLFTGQN